ncbi:hypothetical protein MWU58_11790 [Flavobacteriaceae bacterium S0825]|uniref:hypothetical protein n=1 Tax=Gaetbulibacter sp. S0825 TaxID=2720084 RepID=UPI0014314462|nr:hypothetical protein [Gaetbulibacter sp. S0825]MCK0109979.1 hypothetical protein [Flavobacteriaceae bacterium S0825]NIX65608.1 hypothetical protein [Gaetbulibacter sp. S0825]
MKFFTTLIFFLCFVYATMAQINDSQKGFKIDPVDSTMQVDLKLSFKLSPVKGLTNKNVRYTLSYKSLPESNKKKYTVDMTKKSSLVDKEWTIKQRFSEDRQDLSEFEKDYYLGDLRTTSKTIVIKCRDHEYVDGDRIKLTVNDVVIHPNIRLYGDFYTIDVDLKEGYNTINFIALNEGESSPNTAQLMVLDPDGNTLASNRWLIRTGYKATLVIIKD